MKSCMILRTTVIVSDCTISTDSAGLFTHQVVSLSVTVCDNNDSHRVTVNHSDSIFIQSSSSS